MDLFIEETLPDYSYRIVWRGLDFQTALDVLGSHESGNRLELWSRAQANSPKGFAPFAFRAALASPVQICGMLRMLMLA